MKAIVVLFLLPLAACAWTYPPSGPRATPERQAATVDELADLLAMPVPGRRARRAVTPFGVHLSARWIPAGTAVWITCITPMDSGARTVHWGLEGHASRGPMLIDGALQHRFLIERVSCGTWTAYCAISTGEVRTQVLESRGACNQGLAST